MLVLSRKESEKIKLGDEITITVVRVSGDRVRIGIEAPKDMIILRRELEDEEAAEEIAKARAAAQQTKITLLPATFRIRQQTETRS